MKKLLLTPILLMISAQSFSAEKPCRIIKWHESAPIKIYASLYKHVHVILPSNLSLSPINVNNLWDSQGRGNHLFISPTSNDPLGKSTTISALTDDGNSYDFIAEVNNKKFNACVRIKNDAMLSDEQLSGLTRRVSGGKKSADLEKELESVKRRYYALTKSSVEDKKEAVKQAVRKYRYHIYTRYNWRTASSNKSFVTSDLLSDVYDDGRFTYLRLSNDNLSLPAIEAVVNGKPEFIEAKYDEVADLYRVVGIYPELSLKMKDDEIEINRMDKTSKGEF
ncbi:TrbG/VirB9 family P-type conjugative transfer protein [Pseudoalteromonas nigrifaciens]|uniref:TrbG/VirB9 family P-type conjugative transfer protein n=1 Tax=Pseudoalteromonas nigrifaciens TaxID=28109 RepID=UPI003FCF26B8